MTAGVNPNIVVQLRGLADLATRVGAVFTPDPASTYVTPTPEPDVATEAVQLSPEQERRRRIGLQRLDAFLRTGRKKAVNFAARFFPHSRDDCEDVVQEAAWKAARRADTYDPSRPFETWFFQIIFNASLDRRRTVLRAPLVLSSDDAAVEHYIDGESGDAEEDALDNLLSRQAQEEVRQVLALLDPSEADLLRTVHFYGMHRPHELYGLSDAAFRAALTRAENNLRLLLRDNKAT